MKGKVIFSILICLFSFTAKSQKQDFNFPLGYISPNNPYTDSIWGISFLNFDSPDGNPTISRNTNMILALTGTNAPLSNNNGILLFIYDGHRIFRRRQQLDGWRQLYQQYANG
ncbi:MAG: hypothetical protein IPK76_03685 [Lewinellaceae bacterium]|nr:hypothetical protein [Lewinellaceae bacterium]